MQVQITDGSGECECVLESCVGRSRHQRRPLFTNILVVTKNKSDHNKDYVFIIIIQVR